VSEVGSLLIHDALGVGSATRGDTFYYHDKREYSAEAGGAPPPPPPPPGKGVLEVHAYADSREVEADVEVVGVGKYRTPFTMELAPGSYTLNASYKGQSQSTTVVVRAGEIAGVDFHFKAVAIPWRDVAVASAVAVAGGSMTYAASRNGAFATVVALGAGALTFATMKYAAQATSS
jgi:hypothetical protein